MSNPARFLGFAFANADMLFEIDREATVTFATGAMSEFVQGKDTNLVGHGAARLFEPSDGVKFVTFARALPDGGRAGPLKLKLADGRVAAVALCRLPQNGNTISCTLTNPETRGAFGRPAKDAKTGLASRDGFLEAAAAMADGSSAMTLVDIPGLPDACAKLPAPEADKLLKRIGEAVREAGPKAAGRIGPTTFGAVGDAGKPSRLGAEISQALAEGGIDGARVSQSLIALTSGTLTAEQRLLALRHVVGQFAAGKREAKAGQDLAGAFDAMILETERRAMALNDCVLAGKFELAFQPVVDLATMNTEYHEALSRFSEADNTGETIAFAEALGISDAFDVAVTAKVLAELQANREAHLALNLSGITFCTPGTFGLIAGLLAAKRNLAPRLKIELTESAEIADLKTANQALQALRAMGFEVGLDDFGAGAASFRYLHAFEVDFVKFDCALIRDLGKSKREDRLISGLVKLCRELGVTTVAEGVEDASRLEQVRALGFDRGQGWHLGKPAAKPATIPMQQNIRRKGEKISWG